MQRGNKTPEAIARYRDFWPFYLREHRQPLTRILHLIGTGLAFVLALLAPILQVWWLLLAAFLPGYVLAWLAHLLVERNRPVTFTYPWWSFISDWRMFFLFLARRLEGELARHGIKTAAEPQGI